MLAVSEFNLFIKILCVHIKCISLTNETKQIIQTEIIRAKKHNDIYANACKNLGIIPVSYFAQRTHSEEVIMRHHGLGPKGAQAIAEELEENVDIVHLDLSDNYIASGGFYFGKALKDNSTITFLNLADNMLGMYSLSFELITEYSLLTILSIHYNRQRRITRNCGDVEYKQHLTSIKSSRKQT